MELNDLIMSVLNNDSTLTALIGIYESNAAIFYDTALPDDCITKETINFYLTEPKEGGDQIIREVYIINCRARTMEHSNNIAFRVAQLLNRSQPDNNSFSYCKILSNLPPADNTDVYNTPVYTRIHKRITGGF